ncbi:MAG: hypothetical protein KF787_13850 [Phycisphaeraceae bacterium]|nr:hypothetical protein [Phycisphaerae bacterium]MBX3393719.1 hypothetical protein [Phycisphaeraceae bacterium]HRJ49081.1 hypothetical protein [Phycisphaerales bacterium]
MSPKSGKAGSAVSPAEPESPKPPTDGEPGSMTRLEADADKKKAHKNSSSGDGSSSGEDGQDEERSWIEIEMIDESDRPVTGESYRIELPDGSVAEGVLDDKGMARVEGFVKGSGQCRITFPDLDKDAWEKKS